MIKRLIRKKDFRRKRAQLKGARKLQNEGQPFFVYNICSDLTEINLELKQSDFPKALVGSHAAITEVLLRQILLQQFNKICLSVMQSIGSGKPFKHPLPKTWIKHIAVNGIKISYAKNQIFLLFSSVKRTIIGLAKFCILLAQRMNPVNPNCPYVVFLGLQQKNLPASNHEKSYDIISWYKKSKLKKSNIEKIWAQAKVSDDYSAPTFLILSRTIFPKFNHFNNYLQFLYKGIAALIVTIFGILRGKWWYGYLYPETINLHYVNALKHEFLAEDYFFHNSDWFYKPMWTYEAEKRGSTVSVYCYSANSENFKFNNYKEKEAYGLKTMTWNRIIVWNQQQEDYLKQYCPNATYIRVGSIDFTGIKHKYFSSNKKKIVSVFDVTPTRLTFCVNRGFAFPLYYSEELNLKFLSTIIDVFNDDDWEILWKRKRIVSNSFVSNGFNIKQNKIVADLLITINPDVAPRSLIKNSDAVISMPFTSVSLIAKELSVPTIFYDASGEILEYKSHDITVLKSKNELLEWKLFLNKNKTVDSVA